MNDSHKSKNDIFYFILLILTMITMVVGMTFTYYSLMEQEKEDGTKIKAGSISINYIDGRAIDTYALLPIKQPNLNTKYSVHKKKFSVESDGSLDQTLDLYINITRNEFTNNALKFALYDETNSLLSIGHLPNETGARVLMKSGVYLRSNSTADFTVLIWLEENGENQDHEQGKTFMGGFEITATQVKYE